MKCGLSEKSIRSAEIALPRSLYAITLRDHDNRLIGMGRVVGDLGCHVQITDIAVDPEYQKRGLSKIVMQGVMHFIEAHVPKCATVNLFADVDFLYQKFGFHDAKSKGMMFKREPTNGRAE